MTHKWLTEKDILQMQMDGTISSRSAGLIIADLRKIRRILGRLVLQQEHTGEKPGIASCHLGNYCLYCEYEWGFDGSPIRHDEDCPIREGHDMLEKTK